MMDVDRFKNFNDTFGHPAGNMLRREIADVLKPHVRASDIACRYGGEEFADCHGSKKKNSSEKMSAVERR
jgi:diguanylate cyclase (GGDEF)-like protein